MPEEEKNEKCLKAKKAAKSVVEEACSGEKGEVIDIFDGTMVYFPEEEKERIGHSPNNPIDDEEKREKIIEKCSKGQWARDWARAILGPNPSEEQIQKTAKEACKGLYD